MSIVNTSIDAATLRGPRPIPYTTTLKAPVLSFTYQLSGPAQNCTPQTCFALFMQILSWLRGTNANKNSDKQTGQTAPASVDAYLSDPNTHIYIYTKTFLSILHENGFM